MKVVMIGPFAIYPLGTVLVRMMPLAEALHFRGHEVSIVLPPYDNLDESGKDYKVGNIPVHNVIIPKRFNAKTSMPIKHLLIAERAVRKALKLKPQLVHIFVPTGISGLATMLLILRRQLRLVKVPLVMDIDDWGGYGGFYNYLRAHRRGYPYQLEFIRFQQRWTPRHVDAITVASRTLQALTLDLGVPHENVFYVPNGPRQFKLSDKAVVKKDIRKELGLKGEPTILLYTRFFEYDVKKVVDILKIVKEEIKNVKLLVVGKSLYGKEEEKLLELTEREGLSGSVIFAGWIQYEELPFYLELGDVAIYPFDDTLLNRAKCPGKIVELMGLGKAIIADKVGQIAEYIENGSSGILVDPGDTDAFAQSVTRVLKDGDLGAKIGRNAKERIWSKFNWDRLVLEVEKAYARAHYGQKFYAESINE